MPRTVKNQMARRRAAQAEASRSRNIDRMKAEGQARLEENRAKHQADLKQRIADSSKKSRVKIMKKGGLFGNSQEKFSHMAGAERGFDRKRLRELRRAKRKGESLSGQDAQDLQYMKAVRGDRIKKGIMGGAILGAGALAAGPAIAAKGGFKGIAGALKGKGASGLAGEAAGKGGLKGLLSNFNKAKGVFDQVKGLQENMTPDQQQEIDTGNFGQPDQYGKKGMRIKKRRKRRR